MTREVQFDVGSYPGFVLHLQHFGTHQRQFSLHSEENHQDCHFCQYFLLVVSKLLTLKMHMQTSVRSGYTDPFVVMCVAVSKGSFCVLFGGLLLFPYRGRWDFFLSSKFWKGWLSSSHRMREARLATSHQTHCVSLSAVWERRRMQEQVSVLGSVIHSVGESRFNSQHFALFSKAGPTLGSESYMWILSSDATAGR